MEVVTREECYIKGEDSNIVKEARDIKERVLNPKGLHYIIKSKYISPIKYKTTFKRIGKTSESFTSLNTRCEYFLCEVLHLHNIHTSLAHKMDVMGHELGK